MTVYPVGACVPEPGRPVEAVEGALPPGRGLLIADGWYDDEESMEVMVGRGHLPLIRPCSNRYRGYHRRLRDIFELLEDNYRNRPRGESTFGSLTNRHGERLKTYRKDTTAARILARLVSHSARVYLRVLKAILEFLDTLWWL